MADVICEQPLRKRKHIKKVRGSVAGDPLLVPGVPGRSIVPHLHIIVLWLVTLLLVLGLVLLLLVLGLVAPVQALYSCWC